MMKKIPLCLLFIPLFLAPHVARADGQFSAGIEGFYDRYREPSVDVTTSSPYGSILLGYVYNNQNFFAGLDGRFSYGEAHYKSPDGTISGTPQYDGEVRLRGGVNIGNFSPYTGFGGRFFLDNGTGTFTNLGYGGYDRHIQQYYIPVGADWQFNTGNGWSITPNVEYDQLVYGRVKSDIAPFVGFDAKNEQHKGYGLRGSLMFGHRYGTTGHTAWQVGPFVRYWKINDSNIYTDPNGNSGYEPKNSRVQVGARLKFVFN